MKGHRALLFTLFLAVAPAGPVRAAGGDMSVATFLAKADALLARGPFALFSKDYKLLNAEGEAAGDLYKARLAKERGQGKPSSCPPRRARPSNNQFLGHLRSYPLAVRAGTPLWKAMADYFIRTYPCK